MLVGRRARAMWVMTFHAACARMLRAEAERLGYTRQFTIYDQADSRRLIKRCLEELGVDPKRFTPAAIGVQISDAKNQLATPTAYGQMVGSYFEQTVADVYRAVRARAAPDERDGLRRPARARRQRARAVPGGPRRATRTASGTSWSTSTRTPTTPSTAGCSCSTDEHRNLMVVGDDAQSIYGFRGADIRNILDFEDDFPDAHVVKLEQNYRSTQTILDAANAVIAHNRGRKPKALWTELGQGDPIKVRELDDEHAEARFVAGEIERLLDEGASRSEIAVFYRTNAQSRVLEDTLVRGRDRLPGDRRDEVLRARRDQGRGRLPRGAGQPVGRGLASPGSSTRRGGGSGTTSLSRVLLRTRTRRDLDLGRRGRARAGARSRRRRDQARCAGSWGRCTCCASGPGSARRSPSCSKDVLRETGYLDALEAERTIEAQGRIENLEELVGVAAEYDAGRAARASVAGRVPRSRSRCSPTPTTRGRRRGAGDADDAPQREGPRVRDRVHDRLRGGRRSRTRARSTKGGSRRSAGSATSGSPGPSATCT